MGVIKNLLIGVDQSINCCIKLSDGYGTPDEMLSARAYRLRKEHPALIKWVDRIFFWDRYHCQECYGIEMAQAQFPPDYRKYASRNSL